MAGVAHCESVPSTKTRPSPFSRSADTKSLRPRYAAMQSGVSPFNDLSGALSERKVKALRNSKKESIERRAGALVRACDASISARLSLKSFQSKSELRRSVLAYLNAPMSKAATTDVPPVPWPFASAPPMTSKRVFSSSPREAARHRASASAILC